MDASIGQHSGQTNSISHNRAPKQNLMDRFVNRKPTEEQISVMHEELTLALISGNDNLCAITWLKANGGFS